MKSFINKFIEVEKDIAREKGEFVLFALFLREDSPDRWDVVISADWFDENERKTLAYVVLKTLEHLNQDEMLLISRFVPVDPFDKSVKEINNLVTVEHGNIELGNREFFGIQMKRAHIITSKPIDSAKLHAA